MSDLDQIPGSRSWNRRQFIKSVSVGGALSVVSPQGSLADTMVPGEGLPDYKGPNVIMIRFGGGVRRRETIDPEHTYSPFFCHDLVKRGTLFKRMEIDSFDGIETSHGQGTLYLLTGKYDKYKDVGDKFLGERFESKVPTVFEYFRRMYRIPEHQTLIVNGEDRKDEEFFAFSNHNLYGVDFRSNVLSLYRFKTFLLRRQLESGRFSGKELEKKQKALAEMEALDYRTGGKDEQGQELVRFWERWQSFYGETGLVNPRGDRLLTELTLRAIRELRAKLIMVNYNDPDYVHWGNMNHYTQGISIIDQGIRQIWDAVQADEEYRDNTVFVIVPDCGRDSNPFSNIPCQHHFNSRSAHEIFALLVGPGVARGKVVDRRVDQISVAATVGSMMGFKTPFAEGPVLEEAWA